MQAANVFVFAGGTTELNVPVGQAVHVGGTDELATGLEYWPEPQFVGYGRQTAELVAFGVVEYVPAGHVAQTRLTDVVGAVV